MHLEYCWHLLPLVNWYALKHWPLTIYGVTELKQSQEVAKEQATAELQRAGNSAAAATASSGDDVAMTTSEDLQQKLEETCEQFLRQLKEARRNVGRPEDLQVSLEDVLLWFFN